MTPNGTTGPKYTDQEKDFLTAGAHRGKTAAQIAAMFEKFSQKRPDDFHIRSVESIQVKASQLGLSLAPKPLITIADSGQVGIRFTKAELPKYRAIFAKAAEQLSLTTRIDVVKAGLDALDKTLR